MSRGNYIQPGKYKVIYTIGCCSFQQEMTTLSSVGSKQFERSTMQQLERKHPNEPNIIIISVSRTDTPKQHEYDRFSERNKF